MGHREDQGESQNQPSEEALETNEDKGIGEQGATHAHEESGEAEEETEERTEEAEEEAVEEAPEGEKAEGAVTAEEAVEEKEEETAEAVGEAEEEKEVEREREEKVEEEIVEERVYTIPLRRAWISPRKRRAPRAVRIVKGFIQRHMKPEAIVVSNEVNERLWSRGIEKPPRRIRVRASKDREGTVTLHLAEGD